MHRQASHHHLTTGLSTWRLLVLPVLITVALLILRVEGETRHWRWCDSSTGFWGTVFGIAWLPLLFGPYFGWKLASADPRRLKATRSLIALAAAGLAFILGLTLCTTGTHRPGAVICGFLLTLAAAYILAIGWASFGQVLLAYAFAARIPVLLAAYVSMAKQAPVVVTQPAVKVATGWTARLWESFAMLPGQPQAPFGHTSAWAGLYSLLGASFAGHPFPFWQAFIRFAFLPQMTLWIGWTVLLGGFAGSLAVVAHHFVHRSSPLFARRSPAPKPTYQEPVYFKG